MSYNDVVQAIADASKDADTLEQVVNGEAETQVKSRLGRMIYTLSTIGNRINNLTAQAQLEISNLRDAINAAAAAGAGANGWTDQLIALPNGRTQRDKNSEIVSIKDFGAKGDGITDDTQAIIDAFNYANSNLRAGLAASVKHPTVRLKLNAGRYNLASLTLPIQVLCNVVNDGAEFIIPPSYDKDVMQVGLATSGVNLATAWIELPDIAKPVSNNALVAGSTAVRLMNINASKIWIGRTNYFENGVWCGGIGEGTVYNDIFLGQHSYVKRAIVLKPSTSGWCNANRFHGGNISQSVGFAGGRRQSGWRHLLIDGRSPATAVVGNTFLGTSFEGDASEYTFEVYNAYKNNFIGCYFETGQPLNAVTVSNDTITRTAHGLAVNDKLAFVAETYPSGMVGGDSEGYFVTSIVDVNNFKVSRKKGGAAITFATNGVGVSYLLAQKFIFADGLTFNNRIINPMAPPSILLDIIETGVSQNNGIDDSVADVKYLYSGTGFPLYRAGYKNTAVKRPVFAAYPPGVNPSENPDGWAIALSDKGVLFSDGSGNEKGVLKYSAGTLQYKRDTDAVAFDIPTAIRSQSLINVTATCNASSRTIVSVTFANASLGDHLTLTPYDQLPDGIAIAWSRISAANTLQIALYNWTASSVSISANFQAMATRRYY